VLRRFTLDGTGSSAAFIVAGLALVKFGDAG
jgi:homoserine kinase